MMANATASPDATLAVAQATPPLAKAPSGILGFDDICGGGLPHGRTTLLMGGPGSGKTIFAMQFLVHGARHCQEPGIFVAFEESPERIAVNFEGFGWGSTRCSPKQLASSMPSRRRTWCSRAPSISAACWRCCRRRPTAWAPGASCSTRWTSCSPCCPMKARGGARFTGCTTG